MLPKKIHIDAIEKFHKKFDSISEEIEKLREDEAKKDELLILYRKYHFLTELWSKIDDFCEFEVDHKLDVMDIEPNEEEWSNE